MATGLWGTAIVFLLVMSGTCSAEFATIPSPAGVCPVLSVSDSVLRSWDLCLIWDSPSPGVSNGVVEGDEAALLRTLNLVNKDYRYVSVLFYASWCPFSKICRPNFTVLSFLFPGIYHFAVEESSLRPSILAKYGVHGFPTLFLLNSTTRVRYRGSRTLDSLVVFYKDVTGMKPAWLDMTTFKKIWDHLNTTKLEETEQQEFCPFSWARSPEKLLRQETYLILATVFVLLRILHFLFPTLLSCANLAWRRHMQNASLMKLWDHPQAYIGQAMQVFSRLKPYKTSNLQEGAMNAKAWASKSLASVSIGDAGPSRTPSGSDR
ncbi:hypothetical protein H6P81_011448 [Aristolochia fimbriata]|uniref:Thioredoxin domain-containing protein n=1 Tax=Aristolochia fimbriata TaxID=158543 RepID=A0AAV7ERZ4_ARIFI|nr:hypothetical protein H6P81_011448 [Aristolochia fimbriata]